MRLDERGDPEAVENETIGAIVRGWKCRRRRLLKGPTASTTATICELIAERQPPDSEERDVPCFVTRARACPGHRNRPAAVMVRPSRRSNRDGEASQEGVIPAARGVRNSAWLGGVACSPAREAGGGKQTSPFSLAQRPSVGSIAARSLGKGDEM